MASCASIAARVTERFSMASSAWGTSAMIASASCPTLAIFSLPSIRMWSVVAAEYACHSLRHSIQDVTNFKCTAHPNVAPSGRQNDLGNTRGCVPVFPLKWSVDNITNTTLGCYRCGRAEPVRPRQRSWCRLPQKGWPSLRGQIWFILPDSAARSSGGRPRISRTLATSSSLVKGFDKSENAGLLPPLRNSTLVSGHSVA